MNNKDNYKKAIDQIHASEELKNKTFEKVLEKQNKSKLTILPRFVAICCTFALCFTIGFVYFNNRTNEISKSKEKVIAQENEKNEDLPRFENMDQLKEAILEKQKNSYRKGYTNGIVEDTTDGVMAEAKTATDSQTSSDTKNIDYSKTNTQEENVDEADIVKTDGENIYYVTQGVVYIIDAKTLKIKSTIQEENEYSFSPRELYIKDNKLVILGNQYRHIKYYDTRTNYSYSKATARVYDIRNNEEPTLYREISIDGYLNNSRMIGDNLYLISSRSIYYYDTIKDEELLPKFLDTAQENKERTINCTDIAYFKESEYSNYLIITGFNINKKEKASTETIFGAGEEIYCSENNLYITQTNYKYILGTDIEKTQIYKFKLNNEKVSLIANGEIRGTLNDQFSMDEFKGNLRIATTKHENDSERSESVLYVLDEKLNEIGKIDDIGKGEKIYSVRFVGKVGYIVTFKTMDPLFVVDLSSPENPKIKGELKIPGYSAYLQPYDETHIIGIGYNTKSTGFDGVTRDKMKMSMFDVSDLENPKEMYNVNIGTSNTYSEIISNHKALFYNKDKNLIGFPIRTYGNYSSGTSQFVVYEINLKEGFKEYGKIKEDGYDWERTIRRAIYIEDTLYTLAEDYIVSYDLESLEKKEEIELEKSDKNIPIVY